VIEKVSPRFRAVVEPHSRPYIIEELGNTTFVLKGFKLLLKNNFIPGSKLKKILIELSDNGTWHCYLSRFFPLQLINQINQDIKSWIDHAIKVDFPTYKSFRAKKIATTNANIKVEAKKRFVNYCTANNVDFTKEEFEVIVPFIIHSYKKIYRLMPWIVRNKRLRAHLDSDIYQSAQDNVNVKKILE